MKILLDSYSLPLFLGTLIACAAFFALPLKSPRLVLLRLPGCYLLGGLLGLAVYSLHAVSANRTVPAPLGLAISMLPLIAPLFCAIFTVSLILPLKAVAKHRLLPPGAFFLGMSLYLTVYSFHISGWPHSWRTVFPLAIAGHLIWIWACLRVIVSKEKAAPLPVSN